MVATGSSDPPNEAPGGTASGEGAPGPPRPADTRLALFKALGDNTRYAIYLEIARAHTAPSTAELADFLGLHVNTVRPHLERMREVGLLEVEVDGRGSVGRPQHRYRLAADAPSLGLEPAAFRWLAHLLASAAQAVGVDPEVAAQAAAPAGRRMAAQASARGSRPACVAALTGVLAELGFDPAVVDEGDLVTVAFTHCPFAELAEANPDLVCNLHRGLVEGFVEQIGGADVEHFATLADRDPCQVSLTARVD